MVLNGLVGESATRKGRATLGSDPRRKRVTQTSRPVSLRRARQELAELERELEAQDAHEAGMCEWGCEFCSDEGE